MRSRPSARHNLLHVRRQSPRKRGSPKRDRAFPILVVLPIAAFAAVFFHDGGPPGLAHAITPPSSADISMADRETARFDRCSGSQRFTCVVDGDTFWYRGAKIRIADINAPEVSKPGCAREAELGERATARLIELLNQGAFSLEGEATGRDRDRYGRLLREVTRGGESLGETLTAEGLAERWTGRRRDWC